MQGRNKQIISHGLVALVTFIISFLLFGGDGLNLFGTASDTPAYLTGTLLLSDGTTGSRALVELYAVDGSVTLHVANRNGEFNIENPSTGNYVLVISTLTEQFGYVGSLIISGGLDPLNLTLPETGVLTGQVSGCDDSCVATVTFNGVTIKVQNLQADGSFAISSLAPGTYQLVVYSDSASTVPQEINISSGEEVEVSLSL